MSLTDIVIVIGGIVFAVLLLNASSIINRNPYQRLKIHEDIGVKFPPAMPFEQKQRLLDWWGLAPRGLRRPLVWIGVLLLFLVSVFSRDL
jgi:hypothetical protein